ncbi:MAG: GntR family transcriptional regulator [Planctomycetes bacterium]|nr:GntR family transcriptional regulator [Planctomycetota bacterium]
MPRYIQAKTILAEAIRNGNFRPGVKLPNTSEIGAAINVSLITAHKAIQCLVQEGWLRRERGRGTFVRGDFEASVAAKPQFRIAVVMQPSVELDDFYHGAVMAGIHEAADCSQPVGEVVIQKRMMPDGLGTIDADALLCFHPYQDMFPHLEEEAENRVIVVLGGSMNNTRLFCVDSQNFEGMREAVQHLIALGHRRIAIVNGPLAATNCLHRFEGYMAAMQANGMSVRPEYVFNADAARSAGAVLQRLRQILKEPNRPTAVVACGFYLALDVMALLREMGLGIPSDVSLVGFDDPKSASLLDPPLTTVRQPLKEMGKRAYTCTTRLINGEKMSRLVEMLPTELIVRQSTAAVNNSSPR